MSLNDVQFTCNLMNQRHGWNKYSVCVEHERLYVPEIGCPSCLLDDFRSSKIAPMEELTGWSSNYYKLPEGATELQDLIEHKNMNFSVGNIFKAAYRLGEKRGTDELYDLDKIIWFAQREKDKILRLQTRMPHEAISGNSDGSASPGD